MTRPESSFVTSRRSFPLTRVSPTADGDRRNFRDESWFRRLVAIRPGAFVMPPPTAPEAYDPFPPPGQVKGELFGPRSYLGRVTDVDGQALSLTLWEVPNARELIANVVRSAPGVSLRGSVKRGAPVRLWTWREIDSNGKIRERVHIQSLDARSANRSKSAVRKIGP